MGPFKLNIHRNILFQAYFQILQSTIKCEIKSCLEFIPAGEGESWFNAFSIRIAEHFLLHLEKVFFIPVSPPSFGNWNVSCYVLKLIWYNKICWCLWHQKVITCSITGSSRFVLADLRHDVTSQSFTNSNIFHILKLLYTELLVVSLNIINWIKIGWWF